MPWEKNQLKLRDPPVLPGTRRQDGVRTVQVSVPPLAPAAIIIPDMSVIPFQNDLLHEVPTLSAVLQSSFPEVRGGRFELASAILRLISLRVKLAGMF